MLDHLLDVGKDLEDHVGFGVQGVVDVDMICCCAEVFHVGGDGFAEVKFEVDYSVQLGEDISIAPVDSAGDGSLH